MFMSSIVQTSNFSSAIPAHEYNIDSLALPQSVTIDNGKEAAGEVLKQTPRENRRPGD